MDSVVDAIREIAQHGGEAVVEEIVGKETADFDALDLITYERAADRIVQAAVAVRAALRQAVAETLGDRAARYGDYIYRNGSTTTWKVIDREGLAAWLGEDWAKVVRVDGSNLRRTALRGLAEAREMTVEAVLTTFLEVEFTDRDLQIMPIVKAPKFLQGLAEGEVTGR